MNELDPVYIYPRLYKYFMLLAVFWASLGSGVSEIFSFCKNLGYFGIEFSKIPWILTVISK